MKLEHHKKKPKQKITTETKEIDNGGFYFALEIGDSLAHDVIWLIYESLQLENLVLVLRERTCTHTHIPNELDRRRVFLIWHFKKAAIN